MSADSESRSNSTSKEIQRLKGEIVSVQGVAEESFKRSVAELKTTIDAETQQISQEFRNLEATFSKKLDLAPRVQADDDRHGDLESLEKRLDMLAEAVGRIPSALEAVEGRLDQLAGDLRVENVGTAIESVRVKVETAQTEFTELLDQVVSRETATIAVRDELHGSLDEVRTLLQEGMRRREMKRALVRRRLLDLRDVLQENLSLTDERQEQGKPSLWKKIAGVQVDPALATEECDRIRGVLEEVLRTVEYLIFENNQKDGIA